MNKEIKIDEIEVIESAPADAVIGAITLKVPYTKTDHFGNETVQYEKETVSKEKLESEEQELMKRLEEVRARLDLIPEVTPEVKK